MSPGQDHAGGQALDVPFPGRRQRFIQVIDVEDHVALGRGKAAEVREVGVPTGLHPEAGAGGVGQVGGHEHGGAAIKGEGRLDHPTVANRHQVLQPALVGGQHQLDRIPALPGRFPAALVRAGHGVAQPLACPPGARPANDTARRWTRRPDHSGHWLVPLAHPGSAYLASSVYRLGATTALAGLVVTVGSHLLGSLVSPRVLAPRT